MCVRSVRTDNRQAKVPPVRLKEEAHEGEGSGREEPSPGGLREGQQERANQEGFCGIGSPSPLPAATPRPSVLSVRTAPHLSLLHVHFPAALRAQEVRLNAAPRPRQACPPLSNSLSLSSNHYFTARPKKMHCGPTRPRSLPLCRVQPLTHPPRRLASPVETSCPSISSRVFAEI